MTVHKQSTTWNKLQYRSNHLRTFTTTRQALIPCLAVVRLGVKERSFRHMKKLCLDTRSMFGSSSQFNLMWAILRFSFTLPWWIRSTWRTSRRQAEGAAVIAEKKKPRNTTYQAILCFSNDKGLPGLLCECIWGKSMNKVRRRMRAFPC